MISIWIFLKVWKKNDTIKEYVNRIFIEEGKQNIKRTKILDILTEKYSKTKGEKILDLKRDISGLRIYNKEEILIDKFEDLVTKVDEIELASNHKYGLSFLFLTD